MKSFLSILALTATSASLLAQTAPGPTPATPVSPASRALQEPRGTVPGVNRSEGLSPETREKLRAAQEKYRAEHQALMERLSKARTELNAAIRSDSLDEKLIREKAAAVAQVEADQAVLQAKQYQETKSFLPKQPAITGRPGTNTGAQRASRLSGIVTNKNAVRSKAASGATQTPPK